MTFDSGTDTDSQELQDAYESKEVQQFLQHAAVLRAFAATEAQIKREWERGQSPLEREMAWHKLEAFKAFKQQLRLIAGRRPSLTPVS